MRSSLVADEGEVGGEEAEESNIAKLGVPRVIDGGRPYKSVGAVLLGVEEDTDHDGDGRGNLPQGCEVVDPPHLIHSHGIEDAATD